jgi:hypothetical protein
MSKKRRRCPRVTVTMGRCRKATQAIEIGSFSRPTFVAYHVVNGPRSRCGETLAHTEGCRIGTATLGRSRPGNGVPAMAEAVSRRASYWPSVFSLTRRSWLNLVHLGELSQSRDTLRLVSVWRP